MRWIFFCAGWRAEPGGAGRDGGPRLRSAAVAAVRAARREPLVAVLRAPGRERGEPRADAPAGRAAPGASVPRQPADDAAPASGGRGRRTAPGAAADAADGHGGDLPEAAHQRGQPRAPGVPLSAARPRGRPSGPGVVRGHHLHPCFARLLPSGGRDGLGQPPRPVVAAVEHHGQRVLRRGAGRGAALRRAGDLQHGSGGAPTACSRTFTSTAFTDRVRACGARCSMDGRGRYLDNIFIERLGARSGCGAR